jgi:hypothetical protein
MLSKLIEERTEELKKDLSSSVDATDMARAKRRFATSMELAYEAGRKAERERIMRWSSSNYSRSTSPLYAHVDLLELQRELTPTPPQPNPSKVKTRT